MHYVKTYRNVELFAHETQFFNRDCNYILNCNRINIDDVDQAYFQLRKLLIKNHKFIEYIRFGLYQEHPSFSIKKKSISFLPLNNDLDTEFISVYKIAD